MGEEKALEMLDEAGFSRGRSIASTTTIINVLRRPPPVTEASFVIRHWSLVIRSVYCH